MSPRDDLSPGTVGADVGYAAEVLLRGGVVAFPTETVYGLGADATCAEALARVFSIKGRPRAHPLIVHLADPDQLAAWGTDIPQVAHELAAKFWPGPLTLIVRRSERVSPVATGGHDTVGLRVPSHPMARALIAAVGRGVAAPSANRFGRISPTTAQHVRADLGADVDYVLDGGPCEVGVESTIVDLSRGRPVVLRKGGLPREALEAVLGEALGASSDASARAAPAAPGTLISHYAPSARVVAVTPAEVPAAVAACGGARVAVLAPRREFEAWPELAVVRWPLPDDPGEMARDLYAAMRDLDARDLDVIVAALPAEVGLGEAVADRLRRAAGPRDAPEAGSDAGST